jgi:hypothetical protein
MATYPNAAVGVGDASPAGILDNEPLRAPGFPTHEPPCGDLGVAGGRVLRCFGACG